MAKIQVRLLLLGSCGRAGEDGSFRLVRVTCSFGKGCNGLHATQLIHDGPTLMEGCGLAMISSGTGGPELWSPGSPLEGGGSPVGPIHAGGWARPLILDAFREEGKGEEVRAATIAGHAWEASAMVQPSGSLLDGIRLLLDRFAALIGRILIVGGEFQYFLIH